MRVSPKTHIERFTEPGKYSMYEILLLHGTKCHICNLPIDFSAPRRSFKPGWEYGLQLDHVIPLAKGGSDQPINVKPSHGICNLSKGDKTNETKKHPRYAPVDTSYRKHIYNKTSVN